MTKLVFLGTGGGRIVTLSQERSTGGVYLEDGVKVHIDPGPGALKALNRSGIDPTRTDAICISHCHPDHYASGEILIEGMSFRKRKGGMLFAPRTVIKGNGSIGPAVSAYHRKKLKNAQVVVPDEDYKLKHLKFQTTPSIHSDPLGVGFKFRTRQGIVSFVSDTELRKEIIEKHRGARILILPNTRPLNARIKNHLSTEDSAVFAKKVRPELLVLTHMGKKMLKEDPEAQARWISERSEVKTVAGVDGLTIHLGDAVELEFPPSE
jgi:ribonuclease BN (tRNA processing enzyme)